LADFVRSIKRLALIITILIVVGSSIVFAIDPFVPGESTTLLIHQFVKTIIVVSFGLIIVFFIRRSKPLLSKHVGAHLALVFQFFMILVVGIVVVFSSLDIFKVSPTTLLVGGGIASIVIGLVISTFVGNILAGTLVLMTRPFSVGDTVVVNNIPGKVEEITAMVTRIRNDMGGLVVIPNTAIMQGGVVVTTFPASEEVVLRRLPYSQGDRVYTTYLSQEGIVSELTPFYTKIRLDSGKELTFLNSSVLTGSVAVARISQSP
jgi:small-conductance mechanosensitive channel